MEWTIRNATPADLSDMLALFPRLADFEIPPWRQPNDLWQGDADLLQAWADGKEPECGVWVATAVSGAILGVAMLSYEPDMLNHEPSAHLEVLAVSPEAEGQGIGKALIATVEATAQKQGARSLTLHVFEQNNRARTLYARMGFAPEILRYIKRLEQP